MTSDSKQVDSLTGQMVRALAAELRRLAARVEKGVKEGNTTAAFSTLTALSSLSDALSSGLIAIAKQSAQEESFEPQCSDDDSFEVPGYL